MRESETLIWKQMQTEIKKYRLKIVLGRGKPENKKEGKLKKKCISNQFKYTDAYSGDCISLSNS